MAIRASSSKQIDALVADLASEDEFARESAIARLTVIGARAVDRLKDLATSHPDGRVRAAALRAFEGIGDERTLPVALQAVSDADLGAACAAIAVARVFLRGSRGAEAVDRLTAVALDTRRADRVRIAALDALQDLERKTIAPLLNTLANDASAAVRDQIRGSQGSRGSRGSGDSRGSIEEVRDWLAREAATAPLSALLGIVERARDREAAEASKHRSHWAAIRFATHHALARRKSRIALYDLRESLDAANAALPADALAALMMVGDASCLEPIASAYTRATNAAWRQRLLETYQAIVKREKLTPRHAAIKKVARRWPTFAR